MEIGNKWEYNEWFVTVDSTQAVILDTTKIYFTRVEVTTKDRLFGKDLYRIKYSRVMKYAAYDTLRNDTLVTYDWEQLESGDLWLIGYDSKTAGLVTDDSKLWKTFNISTDTSFGGFTVSEQQIHILDFPLSVGKSWTSSRHPVFGNLRRVVTGIDTLSMDNNILPSYKINYGYDDQGIIIHTWFSAFGKTKYVSSIQQYDIYGNLIKKYQVSYSTLISFSPVSPPTSIKEESKKNKVLQDFILYQNYPNPFNPETTIEFSLPLSTYITLSIYNILGQKIRTLYQGIHTAGTYKIIWDGKNNSRLPLSGGIYLVRLEGNNHIQVKKIVLLK